MAKNDDSPGVIGAGCIAILLMIPVAVLLKGFVASQLWGWFLVPLGVPPITLAHAYGFVIMVGLFTSHGMSSDLKSSEDRSIAASIFLVFFMSVILSLVTLFFGWLCHIYM